MNIRNVLTALLLVVGFSLSAAIVEPTITTAEKSFTVDLNDWASQDARVMIKDVNGSVLLTDKITNKSGRIYNLKNLSSGIYTVTLSNSLKVMDTELIITNDGVNARAGKVNFKPVINVSEKMVDVNVLTQGEDVVFSIYGESGVVYSKTFEYKSVVNKRFDISSLDAGTYTVKVTKGDISKSMVIEK